MVTIQKISSHGWRVHWCLYFLDEKNIEVENDLPDIGQIALTNRMRFPAWVNDSASKTGDFLPNVSPRQEERNISI